MISMRILSEEEYQKWLEKYNEATKTVEGKEEIVNKVAEKVERHLFLIGATAIEDKLQEKVPETIHDLIRAKVRVWMLTGDKLETAENIGKSC